MGPAGVQRPRNGGTYPRGGYAAGGQRELELEQGGRLCDRLVGEWHVLRPAGSIPTGTGFCCW